MAMLASTTVETVTSRLRAWLLTILASSLAASARPVTMTLRSSVRSLAAWASPSERQLTISVRSLAACARSVAMAAWSSARSLAAWASPSARATVMVAPGTVTSSLVAHGVPARRRQLLDEGLGFLLAHHVCQC